MRMGWWNWPGWPLADEWAAFWTFGTFLVASVAAIVALGQFAAYRRELEDRARPYLVADFDFKSVLLYVTLENLSPTLATDVTMVCKPMLRSNMEQRDSALSTILDGSQVIPQMAPGRKMRWLVDRTPDLFADTAKPHRVVITVTYSDPRKRGRRYSDEFVLDLDQYGQASGETDYDNKNWNIADRNERRFSSMQSSLSTLASVAAEVLERGGRRRTLMKGNRRPRR